MHWLRMSANLILMSTLNIHLLRGNFNKAAKIKKQKKRKQNFG